MLANRVLREEFGTNKFGTNLKMEKIAWTNTAIRHQNDELKEGNTDGKFNTHGKGEHCKYFDGRLA
jgi:hypothetical protein